MEVIVSTFAAFGFKDTSQEKLPAQSRVAVTGETPQSIVTVELGLVLQVTVMVEL